MSRENVNSTVKTIAIEYAGIGSQPYFVINDELGIRFIPIERGVTQLEVLTQN